MKTDKYTPASAVFPQSVSTAVSRLKQRLQNDYEQAYPGLSEIIHLVLEEEEVNARQLSSFPHLLFPDLVEAHIANLNLRPVPTERENVFAPHEADEIDNRQPVFALCA